ncbi:MAG: hypothetical protein LWX01_06745 [Deltaproteobacteria bacterium]|nr:hypothetical protein [Deltaproteobacteria bacterium]MDL1961385.1 hypothetical protein [Deltaproteobacteria bacterium]
MQAPLKSIGQTYSKHSGVIAAFHREFIKTGIFPPELGRALTRMVKHCHHRRDGQYLGRCPGSSDTCHPS